MPDQESGLSDDQILRDQILRLNETVRLLQSFILTKFRDFNDEEATEIIDLLHDQKVERPV